MSMTRKHFVLIARTLAELEPSRDEHGPDHSHAARVQWAESVRHFARNLASTNDAFDRERFVKACGLTDENNARP